eukprot:1491476-Pleurochrysis_carterae.AAC.3
MLAKVLYELIRSDTDSRLLLNGHLAQRNMHQTRKHEERVRIFFADQDSPDGIRRLRNRTY